MAEKIRCVIICGSPEYDADFVKSFINFNDYVMCADSGYKTAVSLGIKPDLFVGDFDSYNGTVGEDVECVKLNTHKDDTDTMHCADLAVKKEFKKVVLLCATGARIDHTLGNFCVLKYLSENNVEASIENPYETVQFLSRGEYIYNKKGCTFSIIPFACESVTISFEGDVEYPADNLVISSSAVIGVSNVFNADGVKVRIIEGNALFIVVSDRI